MSHMSTYKQGMIYGITCQVIWGVLPVYWKAILPIDSFTLFLYRILMIALITFVICLRLYGFEKIKDDLRPKENRKRFFISGILIGFNWFFYVWAVNAGFVIQASLGYYIDPIIICVFGFILFKEKITSFKLVAIGLALIGLVIAIIHFQEAPFVAVILGITFAGYAAAKKNNTSPALLSLFYESLVLLPVSLIGIPIVEIIGPGAIGTGTWFNFFLMLMSGPVTILTLALFAEAAKRLPLFTLGMQEYIMPSMTLILGIFLYREPFDSMQFISFVIIWVGLVIFSIGEKKELSS